MRTSPAQLIVVAVIAALFGFAGAASRRCSIEAAGAEGPSLVQGRGSPNALALAAGIRAAVTGTERNERRKK